MYSIARAYFVAYTMKARVQIQASRLVVSLDKVPCMHVQRMAKVICNK